MGKALNCNVVSESSLVGSQIDEPAPLRLEDPADFFPSSGDDADFLTSSNPDHCSDSDSCVEEAFHTSPEDDQDRPAKRPRYAKRSSETLTFLGAPVCRRAYIILLQVGGSTISKIRSGQTAFTNKLRPPIPKHPTFGFSLKGDCQKRWKDIVMFLWHVYHSAAEIMPTNWKTVSGHDKVAEPPFPDSGDPEDDRERLIHSIMQTVNTRSTDLEINLIGPGTFQGPRRSLMHGSRTELFWEYRVFCESNALQPASYTTFMKITNCVLKPGMRNNHLRFRGKTEHGQCDTCFRLREKVRKAKGEGDKMELQKELHRHYLSQWLDRQNYWSCRTVSQQWFSNVLSENERLGGKLGKGSVFC